MKTVTVKYRNLTVSFLVSVTILALAMGTVAPLSFHALITRLVLPLTRLMFFISLGLAAGQTIEHLGWTRQVAVVARPFFRFSNIGEYGSAAFTTAFFSGAAANAMLFEFFESNKISKFQLFLSNYLNHFPAFFLHLPTTMFIVLPLTGRAGALYFLLTFLATLIRCIICLVVGKLLLPASNGNTSSGHNHNAIPTSAGTKTGPLIEKFKRTLPARIVNILIWVLPIYTAVFIMNSAGMFKALNMAVSSHIALQIMPVESLSVVLLSFAAEFTSGFAAAGALLHAGVLTVKQTVLALLLGNILAFPIRALRHQLPRYMGIYSPGLGLQLLLSGQVFRVLSLIFTGTIFYLVA